MYNELIKNLRHDSASALQNCEFDFVHDWMLKAADAIEELQKQLREEKVDNVNLTGWLAEEHAKHLWIPVTERLPEVGKKILVFAYGNDTLTARMQKRTENGHTVFECNGIYLEMAKPGRITHWMSLPEPPESEGE